MHQSSVKPHSFISLATMSFHQDFCTPAARLPFNKKHTNEPFGLLLIRTKYLRKQSCRRVIVEEIRSCLAILCMVVFCSMSFMDTLRIILRRRITKLCKQVKCGSRRTALSKPYNNVGKITDMRMWALVAF